MSASMNSPVSRPATRRPPLLDAAGWRHALRESVRKLAPAHLLHNPVMAVVMAGTVLALLLTLGGQAPLGFGLAVTAILLLTVLFGNVRARTWWRVAWRHRGSARPKARWRPRRCARAIT